jgi:hypothetical protein
MIQTIPCQTPSNGFCPGEKNMKKMLIRFILIYLSVVPAVHADDTTFQSLLEAASEPINIEQGKLTGEGAAILISAANQAQFIALGEAHLNKETPMFTQALLNSVDADRFPYIGIETGPYSAEFLQDMINSEDPDRAIREFLKQYPRSIPFVDHVGEFELLRRFPKQGDEPDRIWGLDQEFIFSARYLLDQIEGYLENEASREYVAALQQRAEDGYHSFASSGATDSLLLSVLTPVDFEQLRETTNSEKNPVVNEIIDQLEASRAIYQAYTDKRHYENNEGRIVLFRTNFMSHFNAVKSITGSAPRVLVKMGSYHSGRGMSPLNHFDIGNFLSEFAHSLGQQSYHIIVIAPRQLGAEGSEDLTTQQPMILPYADLLSDGQPVFVDLDKVRRNMRGGILKTLAKDQVRIIYAYDAVVVLPEFTSATPF